jgi:hypothetical protein
MSRQRTHIILVVIRGTAIRITPPLTISEEREGCNNAKVMDEIYNRVIFRSCFLPLVHEPVNL